MSAQAEATPGVGTGTTGNSAESILALMRERSSVAVAEEPPAAPVADPLATEEVELEAEEEVTAPPAEAAAEPAEEDVEAKPEKVTNRAWERFTGTKKYARELAKALKVVAEDDRNPLDIEALPKPAEIAETLSAGRQAIGNLKGMLADLESATPAGAEAFLRHWTAKAPQALPVIAERLPEMLRQSNPAAYEKMASPIVANFADGAIARMMEIHANRSDPDSDSFYRGAQALHFHTYGEYFDPATYGLKAAPAVDPLEQERAALRAERERLNQELAQRANADWSSYRNAMQAGERDVIEASIDAELKDLKSAIAAPLYSAARRDCIDALVKKINADSLGVPKYEALLEQAKRAYRNPAEGSRLSKEITDLVGSLSKRYASSVAAPYRTAAAAESAKQHAQLRQGSEKTAPVVAGAPSAASVNPPAQKLTRLPGETHEESIRRSMRERSAMVNGRA